MAKLKHVFADLYYIFIQRKIECILFMIGCFFSCAVFKHSDIESLIAWSLEIPDAFIRGGISGYSEILSQNLWNAVHGVVYNPFSLFGIIYGIWNAPILFIHYIFDTGYSFTVPTLLWGKMFFVFLLLATGYISYKIVYQMTLRKDRAVIAAILIWGSTTMMISIGFSGQDEIMYMFTFMMALYFTINNRNSVALFWMAISCLLCPVMLVLCIVVIISMTKKILEVIIRCGILSVTTILYFFLVLDSPTLSDDFVGWYFGRTILQAGNSGISFFAVTIAIVCCLQFFIKRKEFDSKCRFLFFSLSIVTFGICTFSWLHFYRFMTCIPFFVISLLIIKSDEAVKSGLFCLLLFEGLKTVIASMDHDCFLLSDSTRLFGEVPPAGINLFRVFSEIFPRLADSGSIIGGFAVACGIYILVVSYPNCKKEFFCSIPTKVMTVIWTSVPIVIVAIFIVAGVKIGGFYEIIEDSAVVTSAITGEEYLEEYYYSYKSASYVSVTVRTVTWNRMYPDNQKINLDIIEKDTGNIIATDSHSASELPNNGEFKFQIKDVDIQEGKEYLLRFYSPEKIENPDDYMYFLRTDAGKAETAWHCALEKNVITDYDVISQLFLS